MYSLGVLLHHLLGGSPPPQDRTLCLGEGAVDRVIATSTDPDPRRRQATVDDLQAELRAALAVPVDPTTTFIRTRNPYRGLAALARTVLTRGFTAQECARYFPDEACPTFGT